MKDLSPDDRPREKLLRHGAAALGDNELVALVLGSGCAHAGALDVANDLLRARGGLHGLARSSCGDLAQVAGIGPAKAAKLVAALELGRRTLAHRAGGARPAGARRATRPRFCCRRSGRGRSSISASCCSTRKHRVLRTTVVAIGTLNSTVVEPRDVFREAMLGAAAAVVVFHNHPSGDPSPSPDDVALTRRLAAVGELMGIPVVDHIVLGDARYCSLKEMGEL